MLFLRVHVGLLEPSQKQWDRNPELGPPKFLVVHMLLHMKGQVITTSLVVAFPHLIEHPRCVHDFVDDAIRIGKIQGAFGI